MNESTVVTVEVLEGEGKVYPEGLDDGDIVIGVGEPFLLEVPKTEAVEEGASLEDWLKAKFDKDVNAPGIGSASGPFDPRPGKVRLTTNRRVLVRQYNAQNPTVAAFGREAAPESEQYVTASGKLTGDAWEPFVLDPGASVEADLIENNALTFSFYN